MKVLAVFLWLSTITLLIIIMYLSFMNGDDSKVYDNRYIMKFAAWYYKRDDFNIYETAEISYRFRQYIRILLFAVLSFLGTATTHVTFYKCPWIVRSILAVCALIAVAIFTEKFKVYLPTRHFSRKEMYYSIFGVGIGFFTITVFTFIYSVLKTVFKAIFVWLYD